MTMSVKIFLESTAIINFLQLREERFDREYSNFREYLKNHRIKAYIPSSVAEECDEYIRELRVLVGKTLRELRTYFALRTLADIRIKPQFFLILEKFFVDKMRKTKNREKNQLGIIQEYVFDKFQEALKRRSKISTFLKSMIEEIYNEALNIQVRYDNLKTEYKVVPVQSIPELEKVISGKLRLSPKKRDCVHLASLCRYTFEENVWSLLITTDFTHLLNIPTFDVCWVRCIRPRYVHTYLKIYEKIFDKPPIEYINTSYTILSQEQRDVLKIIENNLGIKVT